MRNHTTIFSLIAASLFWLSPARGLMPPHVRSSTPGNNGLLNGRVLHLSGYSLGYAETKRIEVTDETTKARVPFTTKRSCSWIGKCKPGMVGCRQQLCAVDVELKVVVPRRRYRLRWLRLDIRFTANPVLVTVERSVALPTGRICYRHVLKLSNHSTRDCRVRELQLPGNATRSVTPLKPLFVRAGRTTIWKLRLCGPGTLSLYKPPTVGVICHRR